MNPAHDAVVRAARRLADRGLSPGSSGNLSVRVGDELVITPTGIGFADVASSDLAVAPVEGGAASAGRPSKELPLHRAVYARRPDAGAVVHLHAPWSVALSCLPASYRPWLTPYQVAKVGPLPLVPYALPGSAALADAVAERAADAACLLLANHGSIAAAASLTAAVDAAEELEAAARLLLTVRELPYAELAAPQVEELRTRL
ncbi:class II aldolase/adducin family protein [Nocardioides sp. YIM 152315]|uniref:class II aldolase/adducin family protein n=1 Tax=Nocardioides sp. YIM 152315 TaxID=3031760 RepID=UPI0023DB2FDE|nr:class II aldolase/adducin family protein [Nocardioides sp. YIM 152315]MDF1605779.1 class II aldolase/adducin family protein [Nocardioides sp. YIM 152315]